MPRQHVAEVCAVDEPLEAPRRLAGRRMMDHDDAEKPLASQRSSTASQASCSPPSRPVAMNGAVGTALDNPISASGPRRRRNGNAVLRLRRRAYKRPNGAAVTRGLAHIDVVIAGHQGDVLRRSQRFKPGARRWIFGRQRDVDEVAGHRDVVGCLCLEVGDDARKHVAAMDQAALAPPVDKAGRAFADELVQARLRQRPEMRIRQMREHEHGRHPRGAARDVPAGGKVHELPIRMPARNTSAPPTMT